MTATRTLFLTLTACLALAAAGCGGEEDDGSVSDTASLAYKACYDDCIKKGGDAKGCKTRCSQAGTSPDPFKACYDGCIKAGYPDKDCRTRCSGR